MARKKTSSELEHLRGIVRNLEAQNRELKKELAKAKPTIILKEVIKEDKLPRVDGCPKCGKKLKEINLGLKQMILCSDASCDYKKLTNRLED